MTALVSESVAQAISMFREMSRIRAFEEEASAAMARGEVFGSLHSSIGQEAVAVGVCANLEIGDLITSTHRGHHHVLAKGADPRRMMAELFGRRTGTCSGRGGSMHIADFSSGVLGANGIVAGGMSIAVGAAHAQRLLKRSHVVVCFFGDGAINRGPFLESLNWAALFKLKVLFVCEDNAFSAYTRASAMTAGDGVVGRAKALGVDAIEVDGSDVIAVHQASEQLLSEIRGGAGPKLLYTKTYRLSGHSTGDDEIYRTKEEVESMRLHEPIRVISEWLLRNGLKETELDEMRRRARDEITDAVLFARQSEWPPVSELLMNVQEIGAPP